MWACTLPLVRFGSEPQRRRYLPGLCDGSIIGAQAMTEPEAGSDAFSIGSRALPQGDSRYVLNGRKTFVTNAPQADFLLVYASTEPRDRSLGLSAFLIERDTAGLTIGPPLEKMGLRTSTMSEVFLEDCQVSSEQVLGKPGLGMTIFNLAMLWERSCILAGAIGAMRHQLERSVEYARARQQFGRPIGDFQAVSHRIAEMKVRLETARLLVYRLAWLLEHGQAKAEDAALVKLHVSECYLRSEPGHAPDPRRVRLHVRARAGARGAGRGGSSDPFRNLRDAAQHRRVGPGALSIEAMACGAPGLYRETPAR